MCPTKFISGCSFYHSLWHPFFFFFCKCGRKRVGQPQSDTCVLSMNSNLWLVLKSNTGFRVLTQHARMECVDKNIQIYIVPVVYCVWGKLVTLWKEGSLSFFKKNCKNLHCIVGFFSILTKKRYFVVQWLVVKQIYTETDWSKTEFWVLPLTSKYLLRYCYILRLIWVKWTHSNNFQKGLINLLLKLWFTLLCAVS